MTLRLHAWRVGETYSCVVNGEVASFGEGGFGAYEEELCFITVLFCSIHVCIEGRQDSMWVRGGWT
jgi:hypothetical protein